MSSYKPPKVWTLDEANGGKFAGTNRPVAGPTHDAPLPQGEHRWQLHSLATPNGVKVTVMFEELLEAGHDAEYDAWPINIGDGDQFGSGFVAINPNSKIPALFDQQTGIRYFESGSILLMLATHYGAFLPEDPQAHAETMNWLFWQVGSAPYLGGGFGHFYSYAPEPMKYPIDRFTMETKRQLDVLNRTLAEREYIAGDQYTIADMAIAPWYGGVATGDVYDAAEFLQTDSYEHVQRWTKQVMDRPAYKRGRMVNRLFGKPESQLHERHAASDFDTKTQDKIGN